MDTPMAIRSGIFLVAGLLAVSFPRKVFTIQTRVIAFLNETIHFKLFDRMLGVEHERAISGLVKSGIFFLIVSAMLFVWAVYEWGL